jgi:hypothetical protein
VRKRNILPFLSLVCVFVFGFTSRSTPRVSTSADSIESIKAQYAAINKNINRYRKVDKDLPGYSSEGGSLIAYFDGNSIKRIDAQFYGEMGLANEEYYYSNGRLIFVFRKESNYDRPLSGNIVSTKENRFYFSDASLIRWIDENGRHMSSSDSDYRTKQNEYLTNSKEFVTLAQSKSKPHSH